MSHSVASFLFRVCLSAIIGIGLSALPIAEGQVQYASCKFNLFLLDLSNPTDPSIGWGMGANDWGTTVGQAVKLVQGPIDTLGFIRYSSGRVSYYQLNGAPLTFFNARNNDGVTIGGSFDAAGIGQPLRIGPHTIAQSQVPPRLAVSARSAGSRSQFKRHFFRYLYQAPFPSLKLGYIVLPRSLVDIFVSFRRGSELRTCSVERRSFAISSSTDTLAVTFAKCAVFMRHALKRFFITVTNT